MHPRLEVATPILVRYCELYNERYRSHWMPTNEHIQATIEIMESPVPGIPAYTADDLMCRLNVYFATKEDWIVSCKHNYTVFLKHIHRWIGPVSKVSASSVTSDPAVQTSGVCSDCGASTLPGKLCATCYPFCTTCNEQHLPTESCKEVEARVKHIREMFQAPDARGKKIQMLGEILVPPTQLDNGSVPTKPAT